MHTLQLQINDTIFDKFMGLLEILPKDKISVIESKTDNSISFEDAKLKVEKSISTISQEKGIEFEDAFDKVLNC